MNDFPSGYPSREADQDALPGFQKPPKGYGEVAFYWWLGDPLTKERISWQLDQLEGMCVSGLQINYAHTDSGGLSHGFSIPSDPPLFSDAWWELVKWFAEEAGRRGISISLSDYTLGIGQGFTLDDLLREQPCFRGSILSCETLDGVEKPVCVSVAENTIVVAASNRDGKMVDLRKHIAGGSLRWEPPGGEWRLYFVLRQRMDHSLDPMEEGSGAEYADRFFGQFEKHGAGIGGKELNFFFSDELEFRMAGFPWNDRFAAEFQKRKGYDLLPVLPALWHDIGDITPKVRLDFNDVQVALSEEAFFRPVFEWHQSRNMILGCDHWGRGRDVLAFGDYFRTQRWNQGPGCDQPKLERDLIKNKVAASIAHLYERPRVWLEGFHSSGWGTSCEQVADAVFANFGHGQNMLSFHGLYYSTHGTWWEWAPPCNHWRMPYWRHTRGFMQCVERLSYLLSQGHHQCDVAILYPVEPSAAVVDGQESVDCAFHSAECLYENQIDFDFMDAQSLERAEISDGKLHIGGESYRILVIPGMRAMRMATLRKVRDFHDAGGIVLAVQPLPDVSDRVGRNDPGVAQIVQHLFRDGRNALTSARELAGRVRELVRSDFSIEGNISGSVQFLHRKIGPRDVYYLYGVPLGTVCRFRSQGAVELWDPWTGETRSLPIISREGEITALRAPLEAAEPQLIVFTPGEPAMESQSPLRTCDILKIDGEWECEPIPVLDNCFGDFRWPPSERILGPEARYFRYSEEDDNACVEPDFDDSKWRRISAGFGPKFLLLGPLPSMEQRSFEDFDEGSWNPYEFSWRWGVENDPGHQGWHGLKEKMYDDFIRLGKLEDQNLSYVRVPEETGQQYYLMTGVVAPAPRRALLVQGGMAPVEIWINGKPVAEGTCELAAGPNTLLLKYDRAGTGFFLVVEENFEMPVAEPGSLAMRWNGASGILPFDSRWKEEAPLGWYRFKAPPGTRALVARIQGKAECWIGGVRCDSTLLPDGRVRFSVPEPVRKETVAAMRIVHERGVYGGEAIPEPIEFECGRGVVRLGDWSKMESLETYSGGMSYRKSIHLENVAGKLTLDLGEVAASAEVLVNGESAGTRVTAPWKFDISKWVGRGANEIQVNTFNTLANHYLTTPTRYRGNPRSGLLGPVVLQIWNPEDEE